MENEDLRVRNRRHAVKTSPRILHFSPAEEKKLGFPFSENGPSAHSKRGCHVNILRPPRMGGKRCDNP
jgi:hypothetical protein